MYVVLWIGFQERKKGKKMKELWNKVLTLDNNKMLILGFHCDKLWAHINIRY